MEAEPTVVALLLVATVVAMLVQRLKVPYTVALVVVGLALGAVPVTLPGLDLEALGLTQELLFGLFLPVLLFEAAFHVSWRKLRDNLRTVLLLAVPGVAAAIGIAGLLAYWLEPLVETELPLLVAFLFVAMCAATDPVSVIALFKELGVPKRLAVLMEGESLLNDGVAVVAFIALAAVLGLRNGGDPVDAAWVARFFLWEIGVGLAIGVAVGLTASWLATLVENHLIEIMLTTIAAFGSYVLADAAHGSFVLAVVAAGMACGNVGARFGMSPTSRIANESFWEYAAFVVNSLVFLLLGKEIDLGRLAERAVPIGLAWAALMAARALVIAGVSRVIARTSERLPPRWSVVLAWGGVRGSLSMVLALSLPADFAHRAMLIDLTFGVVLVSLLVQGLSMGPVLRWAGAVGGGDEHLEYERLRGRLRATHAALHALDESYSRRDISERTYEALRAKLGAREAALEEGMAQLGPETASEPTAEIQETEKRLMGVQRRAVERAADEGIIGREAANELLTELA